MIQKRYSLLRKFYKETVKPASDKYVTADGRSLCFCRQPASFDDLIQCSELTCKIKWFHFECVRTT